MKILFSILKYQLITNESMNIGVLFHNLDTDERKLDLIKKWSRLKSFDDELNIDILKIFLRGINDEIQSNIFNRNVVFDIRDYRMKFVNELRFTDVYEGNAESFQHYIEECKKNFLRYDYDQKDRPNKEQQIKYMKNLMKSNSINYAVKPIEGEFLEEIKFDYIVNDYAFKVFSFNKNKSLSHLIQTSKAWAYNAEEIKEKYKVIFLYDTEIKNEHFETIYKILKRSAHDIMTYDQGMDFILKNMSN